MPEFFSGFNFTTAQVRHTTAMINRVFTGADPENSERGGRVGYPNFEKQSLKLLSHAPMNFSLLSSLGLNVLGDGPEQTEGGCGIIEPLVRGGLLSF